MGEPDRPLVARLLAGDEQAFQQFFEEYFERVYRFAMTRVNGNASRAEEAAQRTLCRAVRGLGGFRGEAALFSWLAQICRNEIADMSVQWRRDDAQLVSLDSDSSARRSAAAVATLDDPGAELDSQDRSRHMAQLLQRLPGNYGSVLQMKYLEELSVREIAVRLSTTQEAAQSSLARAREALRYAILADPALRSVLDVEARHDG